MDQRLQNEINKIDCGKLSDLSGFEGIIVEQKEETKTNNPPSLAMVLWILSLSILFITMIGCGLLIKKLAGLFK